jgi:hypothetical protein
MNMALLVLAALFIGRNTYADGLPLKDGRYPGPVIVFTLTAQQQKAIDHYRTCQLERFKTMNVHTPYIFKLTPAQAATLVAKKGFSPAVFMVYETYRGFNDAGPHWNLVLRFASDKIEVPLDLVIPDKEAKVAHEEQGWETSNPCFPELAKP